jgi:phosphatidylethanolamine/phosphatidyl-N-methylethanolamine N-methyltransferase
MPLSPISEQWDFLRGLLASPRGVASLTPSSPALARALAGQIDPARPGTVLELGPGTGTVTKALIAHGIAPERITAIEFDSDFVRCVRARCPGVNVIEGDAFNLYETLGKPNGNPLAGIVSGIPLLNYPVPSRSALIEDALARLQPGAPFVQYSYGLTPPMPATERFTVARAAIVWANFPPARVWLYASR